MGIVDPYRRPPSPLGGGSWLKGALFWCWRFWHSCCGWRQGTLLRRFASPALPCTLTLNPES